MIIGCCFDWVNAKILKTKGTIIGSNDLFIAAHAKSLGAILVANNEKEFQRVEGLQIENWI